MSTSGILRSDNIVFYHPLDDFTEYTQPQTWDGSGTFIPARIDSGVSALSKSILWGTPVSIDSGMNIGRGGALCTIDSNTAVLVGVVNPFGSTPVTAKVITVSGTSVTVGSGYTVGSSNGSFQLPRCATFDTDKIVIFWRNSNNLNAVVGTVSGTSISFGTPVVGPTYGHSNGNIISLNSVSGIITYERFSPTYSMMAVPITVSGTTLSFGTETQLADTTGDSGGAFASKLNNSQAVLSWDEADGYSRTAIATVSGTDLTLGPKTVITDSVEGFAGQTQVLVLDSDKVVYGYSRTTLGFNTRIGSISGTTISMDGETQLTAGVTLGGLGYLSASGFVAGYTYSTVGRRAQVVEVQGTDIFGGTETTTTYAGSTGGSMTMLDDTKLLHATDNGDIAAGQLIQLVDILASTPNDYPNASGADRLTVLLWEQNLTNHISEVTIQRDYLIGMTSGYIYLGDAYWSGSSLTDEIALANNDYQHLFIADFEHVASGIWNLSTSIDGSGWVNHGNQTSGVQTIVSGTADPRFMVQRGNPEQWFDELALWAGDKSTFTQFTDTELQKVYDLGIIFSQTLPKYDSTTYMTLYMHGPEPASGSSNLYINGHGLFPGSGDLYMFSSTIYSGTKDLYVNGSPPQSTGTTDLYVSGSGVASSGSGVGRPLDWFIRYPDYNPQLLGVFDLPASSVNINVWDITNGQNIKLSISNSGCYHIGDTGRWGWSTIYLSSNTTNTRQYLYSMESNVGETFTGQFFLDVPEGNKWIHPNNRSDYLV